MYVFTHQSVYLHGFDKNCVGCHSMYFTAEKSKTLKQYYTTPAQVPECNPYTGAVQLQLYTPLTSH